MRNLGQRERDGKGKKRGNEVIFLKGLAALACIWRSIHISIVFGWYSLVLVNLAIHDAVSYSLMQR